MTDKAFSLSEDFSPVSYEAWRTVVEKALDGADFDKRLTSRLYDGIALKPLYAKADQPAGPDPSGFPGFPPFIRGGGTASTLGGWDIRQVVRHPDRLEANKEILDELEHGAASVTLRFDRLCTAGLDPDSDASDAVRPADGIVAACADDLDVVLKDVDPALAPVVLDAGIGGFAFAAFLAEIWKRRGVAATARGTFNIDPLGALAATGRLPMGSKAALKALGALAVQTSSDFPHIAAVGVDSSPYAAAGAADTDDLAYAMATAVAYLRAMTEAGLAVDDACRQIVFTLPVGTDFFPGIAKLRAARMLWARIAEACGAGIEHRRMILNATTSRRVLTRRDPWVNMLRVTVASFAAGVAGADSVTAAPFTDSLGLPTAFARRIARNTQIILQEESSLARVIDPAGGSWFLETLTRQFAEKAWSLFQDVERSGGMLAALTSGGVARRLEEVWKARRANIAKRRDPITGVSEFPNLAETPVELLSPDSVAIRKAASARLAACKRSIPETGFEGLAREAANASVAALIGALGKEAVSIPPLPERRLAEDFEALRDASDAYHATAGKRPQIFLANMGRVAQHTARATYSRNFFEAGGIEALVNEGFADAVKAADAFKASGARLAVLCGSDAQYEELAVPFAQALKKAGALHVTMAGRPGEKKADFDAGGIDDYVFMGCDVLETLRAAHSRLGVKQGRA